MSDRGLFLVLDGSEGGGKTTAISHIKEIFERAGKDVVVTREPGGTPLGESLREILLGHKQDGMCIDAETLMMFAARAEHIDKVIEPALAAGKILISDRFTSASYAYQAGGRQMSSSRISALEQWTQGDLRPDLTIILDVPFEVGLERAGKLGALDRFEKESVDFFSRVRESYLSQAISDAARFRVVDANNELFVVLSELTDIISDIINKG